MLKMLKVQLDVGTYSCNTCSTFSRISTASVTSAPWLSWLKRLSSKQEIASSNLAGAYFLGDQNNSGSTEI